MKELYWFFNTNGDIENGDIENGNYITSSNYLGYGEKQDDEVLYGHPAIYTDI